MRLLNTSTFQLREFLGKDVPRYAILSHTWGKEEVLFQDMQNGSGWGKAGFEKLRAAVVLRLVMAGIMSGSIPAAYRNVTPTDNSLQKCVHLPPEMMASYLALETKTFLRVYLGFLRM